MASLSKRLGALESAQASREYFAHQDEGTAGNRERDWIDDFNDCLARNPVAPGDDEIVAVFDPLPGHFWHLSCFPAGKLHSKETHEIQLVDLLGMVFTCEACGGRVPSWPATRRRPPQIEQEEDES